MGANTYRHIDSRPAGAGTEALAKMTKIVFSSTLKDPWNGRTRNSWTEARCSRLVLSNRYRVVGFPVITGSIGSDRIHDGYPDVAPDMIDSRTFDGRIQLLEYVPSVLAGPAGTDSGEG